MRLNKRLAALALGAFLGANVLLAESVTTLNKKIKNHESELHELKAQLDHLKNEKNKLIKDESSLEKVLKTIEEDIRSSNKKQVRLRRQIQSTQTQIKKISKDIAVYGDEKNKWKEQMTGDFREFYTNLYAAPKMREQRLANFAFQSVIGFKFNYMKTAEGRQAYAMQREAELRLQNKKLAALQVSVQTEIAKQQAAQAQKKELYQTAVGKRLIADQEMRRLKETSGALEKMIRGLKSKKEKTLSAQQQAEALSATVLSKKGALLWPVTGMVVSKYGKQKHADLNIAVINNGIRIQGAAAVHVQAVEDGEVVYADEFRSYGQTVIVHHGKEIYSIYGLLGELKVQQGDKVREGDALGKMSADADAQLYFEFRSDGKPEDPLLWLK